jgi:hypothetical protein
LPRPLRIFGSHNYGAVAAIQFVIFLALIIHFYIFTKKIFPDKKWPLAAVAAAAFFPSFNFYNGQILTESLFTAWLGFSVLLFVGGARNNFSRRAEIIWLGICLGLSALVRVEGLIAISVMILALLFMKFFRQALIVSVIAVLLIFPWMFRNYYHFGNFSLTNGRQEVQYFADATLISRARLSDFPKVSWVRVKKGLRLPMSEKDVKLEFDYNENDIMWRTDALAKFLAEHPELAPRDQSVARLNEMEGYAQDGERGQAFRRYSEKIILSHPLIALADMTFNTIGTLGPELPTVFKDNIFFPHRLLQKIFSAFYALFYLAVYACLFLLLFKIFPWRRENYPLYVLYLIAAGVLTGHSIFSFTTRFNTPLFMIYFLLLSFFLDQRNAISPPYEGGARGG